MAVSDRELKALEIIQRYRGQTGHSTVARVMRVGPEYAKTICQSLGEADYINVTTRGMFKITDKGIKELLNRRSITLEDLSDLSPSGQSLEPAEEVAEAPQETAESKASSGSPEVPRQEAHRATAATARRNIVDLKCAYCSGRGLDPFGCPGPTSKCAVCGGKGYNCVVAPYATCPACGGTGKAPGRRVTCTTCRGKGVVAARPGSRIRRQVVAPAGATAPTAPGIQRGQQAAPVSLPRSERPASVADRIATHITHFPGIKAAHVEALFGLSGGDTKETLQELVQAHRIRLEDDGLYYPAR